MSNLIKNNMALEKTQQRKLTIDEEAELIDKQWDFSRFATIFLTKRIHDDKIWERLGYSGFREWVESKLYGKSQAYKDIKIASKIMAVLPQGEDRSVHLVDTFAELGKKKMEILVDLSDPDFKELFSENGQITVNGNNFDLQDIRDMSIRAAAAELKKVKSKYSGETAVLNEKLKKALSERKTLEAELTERDEKVARARELERMYGKGASKIEDKYKLIADAKMHISMAQQAAVKSALVNTDPVGVQREMAGLIRTMDEYRQRLVLMFGFVVEAVE